MFDNDDNYVIIVNMALWLNRLEYRTVDPVVTGSSPVKVAKDL